LFVVTAVFPVGTGQGTMKFKLLREDMLAGWNADDNDYTLYWDRTP
jgi:hypothetical protein